MKLALLARAVALFAPLAFVVAACAATEARVADTTYMGQQLRCVQENATREAIDRCREDVRRAWHVVDAGADALDGGGDGG